MLIKLNRFIRKERDKESGSAMIFAMMILMVMLLSVTLITSSSLSAYKNSSTLQVREVLKQAALAGIQNSMLRANNSLPSDYAGYTSLFEKYRCNTPNLSSMEAKLNCFGDLSSNSPGTEYNNANPVSDVAVGQFYATGYSEGLDASWRWFTQKLAFNGQTAYYVYAIGYSTDPGVTETVVLQAEFSSIIVDAAGYQYSDISGSKGIAMYRQDVLSPWQHGITGTESITVSGNVYSDDSNIVLIPTGEFWNASSAATNGTITLNSATSGPAGISFATDGETSTCIGCETRTKTIRSYLLKYSPALFNGGVETLCPQDKSNYVNAATWHNMGDVPLAGDLNGTGDFGKVLCVGSLTINGSVDLPAIYDENSPLIVVVAGNVEITSGSNVNQTKKPAALQIITTTGAFEYDGSSASRANMLVASTDGDCIIKGGTFFGSVNCKNVDIQAGSTFYTDITAASVSPSLNGVTIWTSRYYYEL